MLSILVWTGLVLLIAIAAIICTPVRVRAIAKSDESPSVQLAIGLLGGLLPVPAKLGAKDKKPDKDKTGFMSGLAWRPVLQALPKLLRGLIARVEFQGVRGHVVLGLPDPADTGRLYGMTYPVLFHLNRSEKNRIHFEPDYDRAAFAVDGQAAMTFIPAALLPPVFSFGWSVFVKPRMARRL